MEDESLCVETAVFKSMETGVDISLCAEGGKERYLMELPFILDKEGRYDVDLNQFIYELAVFEGLSTNTVKSYAFDIAVFCRFLDQAYGKTIWECSDTEVAQYRFSRLHGVEGAPAIDSTSWNRSVAALERWATWSIAKGKIDRNPFTYVRKKVRGRTIAANTAYVRSGRKSPGFVSYTDYLVWRDVGLRGYLPDGQIDPCWKGRNSDRNSAFSDLLVTTGMRLGEAANLLLPELPRSTREAASIQLSAAVCKGGKGRKIYPRSRELKSIDTYIAVEREEAMNKARTRLAQTNWASDLISIQRLANAGLVSPSGDYFKFSRLRPQERRRLLYVESDVVRADYLCLWLSASGKPMEPDAWKSVFEQANKRCQSLGVDIRITPHMLRHTFAVHMLNLLMKKTVAALSSNELVTPTSRVLYRSLVTNPMRRLQLLLGHQREETVYIYLDYLDESQELLEGALEDWEVQETEDGIA